jgi:hypothetical protein
MQSVSYVRCQKLKVGKHMPGIVATLGETHEMYRGSEMERYETVTVACYGVKMLNMHFCEGGTSDIIYQEQRLIEPAKTEPPEDSSVIISEDGNLIYRVESKYWTCVLTPNERKLIGAVAATDDKKLDGNVVFKMFDLTFGDDKLLRNIISNINGKLSRHNIPLRLSFTDWFVRFVISFGL